MEISGAWLEVLLQKSYEENNLAKVLSIDFKPGTEKGDNYMSEIKRVKMDILTKSGKKLKKSVIVKGLPQTEFHQGLIKDMSIFIREITMYRDVIPRLEDLMREHMDYTEPMWPQMIGYRQNDLLVLNDLAEYGYRMGNRKEGLDLEHCILVLRCLAKFHASSIICQERGYVPMELYGKHIFKLESSEQIIPDLYKQAIKHLIHMIENNWGSEWQPILDKIKHKLAPNIVELVLGNLGYDKDKFNVMNHGDCWVNNMMFKYGIDSIRPISMKFVDLQISFYNSPAFDLQYFLSTSPNLELRQNSTYHLIQIYYKQLVEQLQSYSYKGDIVEYEKLVEEFQRNNAFGLVTAITLLPYVYRNEADASFPEIEDVLKDLKERDQVTIPGCENPQYNAVLKILLTRMDNEHSLD